MKIKSVKAIYELQAAPKLKICFEIDQDEAVCESRCLGFDPESEDYGLIGMLSIYDDPEVVWLMRKVTFETVVRGWAIHDRKMFSGEILGEKENIIVTGYEVDHSAYDAYMYLVEADGTNDNKRRIQRGRFLYPAYPDGAQNIQAVGFLPY